MSFRNTKLFKGSLAFASAALAIYTATAADASTDIAQQVRDLLTGTVVAHQISQPSSPEGNAAGAMVDSQQFAQQLLLGTTASRAPGAESIKPSALQAAADVTGSNERPLGRGDTQAAVRRVLLGQHFASDAS